MVELDRRVRLLGRVLALASIDRMDDERLRRAQRMAARDLGHNRVLDFLFGGLAPAVTSTDGSVAGAEQPLRIRAYSPDRPAAAARPMVVHVHGGGWSLGGLRQGDWVCSSVAAAIGAVVVSVDYRLAPAHPWPAAAEDCYAAVVDLVVRAAEFGAAPDRLAVMGESGGGNLAAVVALMARDRSGPAIAFQALLYPVTDLTLSSPSVEENATKPIGTKADLVAHRDRYLGGQDPRHPYASPLFAPDHAGLPPALVQVAEHDPVRDDGLRYAEALRAAGVPVRTTTYVGMPHGYLSFPRLCRCAPQAMAELCGELGEALRGTPA